MLFIHEPFPKNLEAILWGKSHQANLRRAIRRTAVVCRIADHYSGELDAALAVARRAIKLALTPMGRPLVEALDAAVPNFRRRP